MSANAKRLWTDCVLLAITLEGQTARFHNLKVFNGQQSGATKAWQCVYWRLTKLPEGDGDRLWQFIREVYKRELSDEVIAVLAAGPLEDLLAKRGVDFIDRIEELARKDPKFNYLLGGVWRNTMTDEV